jgi:heme O synthase-like polyprenyltransferase
MARNNGGRTRRSRPQKIDAQLIQTTLTATPGGSFDDAKLSTCGSGTSHALTFLIFVFAYTPLKRRTPLNTLVGAISGARPPVIGWTAVRGSLNAEAVALFAVLFLWQVPHFLAIAWIYRAAYCRAELRMLPSVDLEGSKFGRQMICYCPDQQG